MRSRTLLVAIAAWVAVLCLASAHSNAAGPQQSASNPSLLSTSQQRTLLDRYCVVCHNEILRTAGLTLDKLDLADAHARADVWEKVVRKLRASDMPPAGRPRPDGPTYDALATSLEKSLDVAAKAAPNPGRPALHRLNRTEYGNV